MKPVVDRLEPEYEGVVEFRLINVETDPQGSALMQQYEAAYVPTFVFLSPSGDVVEQAVGSMSEDALRAKLDALGS
jgi:thiol:disulfide interchange protein